MKRLLLILLIPLISLSLVGQKISEMTVYDGNPAGAWVPIVLNNTNRKIDAALLGYDKVQTISVSHGVKEDTLFIWKNGAKAGYALIETASYFGDGFLKKGDTTEVALKLGSVTLSGDGVASTITIPHGLDYTPAWYSAAPISPDAGGYSYLTADNANIYVHYGSSRPSGIGNLKYNWSIKRQ